MSKCESCGQDKPEICVSKVKTPWSKTGQCQFPAVKDGFCQRHHPKERQKVLIRRILKADENRKEAHEELIKLQIDYKKLL